MDDPRFEHDWTHTMREVVIGPEELEINALIIFPLALCYLIPGWTDILFVLLWGTLDLYISKQGYTVLAFFNRLKVRLTVSTLMGGHDRNKTSRLYRAKQRLKRLYGASY